MFGWKLQAAGIQEISTSYLEQMAAEGWMLQIYMDDMLFFRKSMPRKLRFAVDALSKEQSKIDEKMSDDHVQEYLELCQECGWTKVCSNGWFYIFCTEDENALPLQTDPTAYGETVYRQKKKRWISELLAALLLWLLVGDLLVKEADQLLLSEYGAILYPMAGVLFGYLLYDLMGMALDLWKIKTWLRLGAVPQDTMKKHSIWFRQGLRMALVAVTVWGMGSVLGLLTSETAIWWILLVVLGLGVWTIGQALLKHVMWQRGRASRGGLALVSVILVWVFRMLLHG